MVSNFFKDGAKKSGLARVYTKALSSSQGASEKAWAGYCTLSQIMEKSGVNKKINF